LCQSLLTEGSTYERTATLPRPLVLVLLLLLLLLLLARLLDLCWAAAAALSRAVAGLPAFLVDAWVTGGGLWSCMVLTEACAELAGPSTLLLIT
jgi:hypothetical protein